MKHSLDAIRLMCPMPVIRLSQKINELETGDTIEITATDPGVKHDIPAWCRVHGHNMLNIEEKGDHIILLVEINKV
jgi:tRNA 2-thiouridine synthesizing protein A